MRNMKQKNPPTKQQLSMDLNPETGFELTEVDQDAVVAALAELLLEAHGQEMHPGAADQGGDHER